MRQKVEFIGGGLKCDSPTCDWRDETIKMEDYPNYLNSPCPKCGENILTQQDLDNINTLFSIVYTVNNMSEEEIAQMNKIFGVERPEGPDKMVTMTINTHKKLSVENIEVQNENNDTGTDLQDKG